MNGIVVRIFEALLLIIESIDAQGWKFLGGGNSEFCQKPRGVNAFRAKLPGGPLFWVLLHFY